MREKTAEGISYVTIGLWMLIIAVPLSFVVLIALSDWNAFNKNIFSVFETGPVWENFVRAWVNGKMSKRFLNTGIVLVISLSITNICASFLGYSIKKYSSRFSSMVYYLVLAGTFIPVQALMLPLYNTMSKIGLLNTYLGLALVYSGMAIPLATLLYGGFYRSLPGELLEAAEVDGCGSLRTYFSITLPLAKPIITTVCILSGLNIWKDFYINLIVISDVNKKLVSTAMLSFVNEYTTEWSGVCAAMVMQSLPVIIIYLLLQKQFIRGITAGAVKG